MIESIHIQGFKSLLDVRLRLGALNVFVGANASGKSNFFDALRVLQGLAYGFTVEEILNGKPRTSTSETWEAIRGGSANASFRGEDPLSVSVNGGSVTIAVELRLSQGLYKYEVSFLPAYGSIENEKLEGPDGPLYDTSGIVRKFPAIKARLFRRNKGRPPEVEFERSKPILHQLIRGQDGPNEWFPVIDELTRALGDVQRIDPSPDMLRGYSRGLEATRMGERGENFAALVNAILKNPDSADAYTAWLQQLTPAELDRVTILHGALREPLFAVAKNGHSFAAPVLSDGTLRFAAIAATFFQPDMPKVLLIEEIEKGLHPTRLRLMVELLKSQSRGSGPQVIATTHSPLVLSWLDEQDYRSIFFCAKHPETGASSFTPLSEIQHLADAVKTQPLGDLFSEGWMEATL